MIIMGFAYYLDSGSADWIMLCGFVTRNALSEQNNRIPDQRKAFQKILIINWLVFVLVLVQAYAGCLRAMFTKPQFHTPIKTLEELEVQLRQNEISLVIERGTTFEFYMRTAKPGTYPNLLYKQAVVVPRLTPEEKKLYGTECYAAKLAKQTGLGRVSTTCTYGPGIWPMIANDFSTTGKCNFYLIEEKLMSTVGPAAFQAIKIVL